MALMKKNAKSIAYDKKFELIRINNWPDLKINEIWRPDSSVGYTQVPKKCLCFCMASIQFRGTKNCPKHILPYGAELPWAWLRLKMKRQWL